MTTDVLMPKLGESVVEGKISRWLKNVGDTVAEFEPLLEVETDKITTEVTATAAGTLSKILCREGEVVAVNAPIAVIDTGGQDPGTSAAPIAVIDTGGQDPGRSARAFARSPLEARASGQLWVSPVVGRIAAENGVDINLVAGTGDGGRVTKKDILAYIETLAKPSPAGLEAWEHPGTGELFRPSEEKPGTSAEPAAGSPSLIQPLSTMRRAIAEHMVRSVQTSPHVTTVFEADMSRVVAHRLFHKQAFERDGASLTFTPYFVAAIVSGLKAHPAVNSSWAENAIRIHPGVNIGVAVSLGEAGLIVPVVHNADMLNLLGLARAVGDLAERARQSQLKPDDTRNGTFTLTNHGVSGSLFAMPIINQPQCAILSAGRIEKRVVVVSVDGADSIAIKPMCYLGLTFDHRILDGAAADAFMTTVKGALETWT